MAVTGSCSRPRITVHPDEGDALEAVRVDYVTAEDGVVSAEELLDFCHRQGLLVYSRRAPIPFPA